MLQRRNLRAAECYGRVAADSRALWGEKAALCVVHLKLQQSQLLVAHVLFTAAVGAAAPLWLEAQLLLSECRRILNTRLDANTCLVGRCFATEEDFLSDTAF